MSPYPAQLTRDELIETAWELVEANGFDQLSLSKLAAEFGVKAPSLYRHVKNKAALLKAINEYTESQLYEVFRIALSNTPDDPSEQLQAIVHGLRRFALAHPITYTLMYTTRTPASRPDPTTQEQAILPLQALMAQISGEVSSLHALRGLFALVHGFAMLEINEQLRREGDIGEAFQRSVEAYLRGWNADE